MARYSRFKLYRGFAKRHGKTALGFIVDGFGQSKDTDSLKIVPGRSGGQCITEVPPPQSEIRAGRIAAKSRMTVKSECFIYGFGRSLPLLIMCLPLCGTRRIAVLPLRLSTQNYENVFQKQNTFSRCSAVIYCNAADKIGHKTQSGPLDNVCRIHDSFPGMTTFAFPGTFAESCLRRYSYSSLKAEIRYLKIIKISCFIVELLQLYRIYIGTYMIFCLFL